MHLSKFFLRTILILIKYVVKILHSSNLKKIEEGFIQILLQGIENYVCPVFTSYSYQWVFREHLSACPRRIEFIKWRKYFLDIFCNFYDCCWVGVPFQIVFRNDIKIWCVLIYLGEKFKLRNALIFEDSTDY